jgi:hypothetical protein
VFLLSTTTTGATTRPVGNLSLQSNTSGSNHVVLGRQAGDGITTVDDNIIIGHLSGVHSVFGQVSNRCFIGNIFGAPVNAGSFAFVLVDSDGRLGTFTVSGADPGGFSPKSAEPAVPDTAKQAMLNRKVEELQKQVETFTAQLKEHAAQIQKVSAQLEVSKPAPQTVFNNH